MTLSRFLKPYLVSIFFLLSFTSFCQKLTLVYDTGQRYHMQYIKNQSDSTSIIFDNGFHNQPIEIDINNQKYIVKYYITNESLGYAGHIKIPKIEREEKIGIKIDSVHYGDFILDKNYSCIHFNYSTEGKELFVSYTNHVHTYE